MGDASSRKVLVVTPYGPGARDAGERVRLGALVDGLAATLDTTLLTWEQPNASSDDTGYAGLRAPRLLRRPSGPHRIDYIVSLLMGRAVQWHAVRRRLLLRIWVRREIHRVAPDVIFACQWSGAAAIPKAYRRRLIVDTHNAEGLRWQRIAQTQDFGPVRLMAQLQAQCALRLEKRVGRQAGMVTAVSEADRQYFESLGCRTALVHNGFWPVTDAVERPRIVRPPLRLLFLGSLAYSANLDALRWLAEIAVGLGPLATITVAGSGDARTAREIFAESPNVSVIGRVEAVGPIYTGHDALVVPLRMGGGSRLKIIEAVAHGTLVVSSSVGAEGSGLEPSLHYLEANDTQAWIRIVERLLAEPDLSNVITRRAQERLVGADWSAAVASLLTAVEDITHGD